MTDSPKPSLFRPGIGKRGMTELHWAAYCGDPDGAQAALALGCQVNATDEYRGYTPLHWLADMAATGGDRLAVLDLLVRHGADLNTRSETDMTALSLARDAGSNAGDELADALVQLGAVE
jgi:ankyrin repeat protein